VAYLNLFCGRYRKTDDDLEKFKSRQLVLGAGFKPISSRIEVIRVLSPDVACSLTQVMCGTLVCRDSVWNSNASFRYLKPDICLPINIRSANVVHFTVVYCERSVGDLNTYQSNLIFP
jgi:hypothetical protein